MKRREDITMICVNCGKKFVFSVGEQLFFEQKGFRYPIRCKDCRGSNNKHKKIVTIVGKKNHVVEHTPEKKTIISSETSAPAGKRCRDCSIGNSNNCPNPTHIGSDKACEQFKSKKILTKEMEDSFPTQGRATRLKYGKAGQSQFKRSKHESNT